MAPLQRILRKAQRRALFNHALERIGWTTAAAATLALLLLMLDRFAGVPVPEWGYWAALGVGLLLGFTHALLTIPDRFDLAVRLDRALNLKDRIGTATTIEFGGTGVSPVQLTRTDPDFAELVRLDAARLAESVDVRAATPIQFTRIWGAALPLVLLLIAGVMFLPVGHARESSAAQATAELEQVRHQATTMAQTIQQTMADLPRAEISDERATAELEALDRLAQQLADQTATPEQLAKARDESAARLNELSDLLARQSQRDLAAAQEVAKRFAGLDKTGAPRPPMSAREFHEALQRGDFGRATAELEELLHDPTLSEQERLAAAEHLRDLAERLDQSAPAPEQDQPRKELAQALQEQGLDEQSIEELLEHSQKSEEELRRDLEQRNVDEEIARQLAREIQSQNEQRQIDQQAERTAQEVKDSLRQAAEELQSKQASADQSDQQRADEPQKRDDAKPLAPDSAGGEPPKRDSQPSSQQQQQIQQQQQQQSTEQQQQQPSSEQQQNQEPTAQQDKPLAPGSAGGQQPQPQPDPQTTQAESRDQSQQPSPAEALRRMSQQRDQAQQQQQSAEQLRKLAREFMENTTPEQRRELMEQAEQLMRQQMNQQSQDDSQRTPRPTGETQAELEELNQIAREMFDKMTPQERQELAERIERVRREQSMQREQTSRRDHASPPQRAPASGDDPRGMPDELAQSDAPQPPRITGVDDLDLRGKESADRIIAQWLDEQIKAAPGETRASSSAAPPPVRQAQQVAERAVNETAVQKRYHKAIQRYFGRLNETVEKAASEKRENAGERN